jgi:uncharacterized membrane protein
MERNGNARNFSEAKEISGVDAATQSADREGYAEGLVELAGLKINVARPERWASALAGAGLLYYGIRRRSWAGTLAAALGAKLLLRGFFGTSLIYRFLGINTAESYDAARRAAASGEFRAEKSIAIDRSPEDVYRFWRNFENLPRVMKHLKSVRAIDEKRSHWVVKAPAGVEVEWDAEITEDRENRRIAWRSLEGSEIANDGAVLFEPLTGDRTTELRVRLQYSLPAGRAGKAFAKIFGKDPDRILDEDLRHFKSIMEAGETAFGQPALS